MSGCIYRTKDGECSLWTDGKHHSFCDLDGCTDKRPSNADCIRSMTDEELANVLSWLNEKKTADSWLDWLRQEATE